MAHTIETAALHRKHYFRSKYGITVEEAEALLAGQGGLCAICRDEITLGGKIGAKVDHCHATGRVRGILCGRCNTGIGQLRDDPAILASAIAYLGVAG